MCAAPPATAVNQARAAFEENAPGTKEAVLKAISALDKAAEKGVIHKNNAARRKGRLMKTSCRPCDTPAKDEAAQKQQSSNEIRRPLKKTDKKCIQPSVIKAGV